MTELIKENLSKEELQNINKYFQGETGYYIDEISVFEIKKNISGKYDIFMDFDKPLKKMKKNMSDFEREIYESTGHLPSEIENYHEEEVLDEEQEGGYYPPITHNEVYFN